MLVPLLLAIVLAALSVARPQQAGAQGREPQAAADRRLDYDVQAYWLDLRVDPERERIEGAVVVEARILVDQTERLELDLVDELSVRGVGHLGEPLEAALARAARDPDGSAPALAPIAFEHRDARLSCRIDPPAARGATVSLRIEYEGSPRAVDRFDGFHWERSADGRPWISTSCQGLGAHSWWPCKASFFHPEDKPERLFVHLTVPGGLYAVSNGRLEGRASRADGWETFRWRHEYPLETYAVTLNVAPYVVVESQLELEGVEGPVPFIYYVLPEDQDKARVQFAELPGVIAAFSRAFGPWPFPRSKVALVQTSFWGMEHSTAVAYGSSFPAWIAANGGEDPYAGRNRWFDYILVHETAHEWWGNAVSAADWGDFWLHEGFATYAEGVYVEQRDGPEAARRYFAEMARSVPRKGRLYRGQGTSSGQAYSGILYAKGGAVLNTLRCFVDDDQAWWTALREFNLRFRYMNATTEDFREVLEEVTARPWGRFFAEWVHGDGIPRVNGRVSAGEDRILVAVENDPPGEKGFHLPLDLAWSEAGAQRRERIWLDPGTNKVELSCTAAPTELRLVGLERVLGRHKVAVE